MENNRDDLVVILAGYKDRMDKFFHSIRHALAYCDHIDFPDYSAEELLIIAKLMLAAQITVSAGAEKAFAEYIPPG